MIFGSDFSFISDELEQKLVIRIKDTTPDSVSEHAVNAENTPLAMYVRGSKCTVHICIIFNSRTINYEAVERVICTDSEKILLSK